MVGAVIVYGDVIIGEGFTSAYGGAHAEVNAIAAVKDKTLLQSATLYVTLEPCAHFGKTPPCADLIIAHKIPRVVIGIQDPYHKVAGQGIEKLRAAGCEVLVNVCATECHEHHKRFLTFHEKKRPYIILKWAQTLDGYIAPKKESRKNIAEPFMITSLPAQRLVHKWRSEEQAILVGTNTVLDDNPKLTVRLWHGKNPLRIVIDREMKIGTPYHVLAGKLPTLFFTGLPKFDDDAKHVFYQQIDFQENIPMQVVDELYKRNINSLIIEGGAATLQRFLDAGLWDEARVFTAKKTFGSGLKAPNFSGNLVENTSIGDDLLTIFTR